MLNTDMAIYLDFTANSTGHVNGSYCSQGNNASLVNCSSFGSQYLPVHPIRGPLARQYAFNNTLFLEDLIEAFKKMTQQRRNGLPAAYNTLFP